MAQTAQTTHLINSVTGCLQDYVPHGSSKISRRPPG